jgi:hypothetical protein
VNEKVSTLITSKHLQAYLSWQINEQLHVSNQARIHSSFVLLKHRLFQPSDVTFPVYRLQS